MDENTEESGMLRMTLLEHLEELRERILKALYGFSAVFLLCVIFSNQLFKIIEHPGLVALQNTGNPNAHLVAIDVMEQFSIVYLWTPVVAALFLGCPWILWQLWAFISPGLYQHERRWAVPFLLSTAGLFIAGGLFGYFIAWPDAMSFLLNIGGSLDVTPAISIDSYFDKFVDVMLTIGLVFELPVVIFFLTLLRVASPSFLLDHSRYAIIAILIVAAFVTPTTDGFTLMLFAVPMCLLFFVGVFGSYLLVLKRENRRFPWRALVLWLVIVAAVLGLFVAFAIAEYNFRLTWHWPFLVK